MNFLQRNFDFVIAFGLATLLALAMVGCGDTPAAPSPQPAPPPVAVVTPPPPVVVVPPAPAAYCPFVAFEHFEIVQEQKGQFDFSWDVVKDDKGAYLRRYQIEVFADGKGIALLEAEADRLGGRHNRTAFYDWAYSGSGKITARIRVHYPNECRNDGSGNDRANGPWSEIVASQD